MSGNNLHRILKFTDDDLISNREGILSPHQEERFKRVARRRAGLFLVLMGIFSIMPLLSIFSFAGFDKFIWLAVAIVFGLIALYYLTQFLNPKIPEVKQITGHLIRGNPTSKGRRNFHVEINDESFVLSPKALDSLFPSKVYTVYLATNDNTVLALEEARDTSDIAEKSSEALAEEKFQRLYHFTNGDLAANTQGQLSDKQLYERRAVFKNYKPYLGFSGILALIGFAFVLALSTNIFYAAIAALVLFIGSMLFCFNWTYSQLKALENPVVLSATGTVTARVGSHTSGTSKHSYTVTDYYLYLGETRFRLPLNQYLAFKENNSYTIYYRQKAYKSIEIISAKQLPSAPEIIETA